MYSMAYFWHTFIPYKSYGQQKIMEYSKFIN
jgi:hypothetical protein